MCQVVKELGNEQGIGITFKDGDQWQLQKGDWLIPHMEIKLKCIHPDGRSDTYLLKPGQKIVADEDARFEFLTVYPRELEQEPHPVKKEVPVGSPE